jgi:hypothetical protein
LAVQPADPWHNVKAGIKGVSKKKSKKVKTVSEDIVMPSERPEGFLLTVSRHMPWGDGPPLTEEEMDERTLGPGIRNTIPLWERYVDNGMVNA